MEAGSTPGTVVLVHGGFVDGSGWQGVYNQLKKDGYSVAVVQNPTLSHADDVAVTKRVIDAQSEPVMLVGHSYGGAVITEAGNHPKVAALVYIAAFVPDKGESVNTLIGGFPTDGPQPPIIAPAGRVSASRPGQVSRGVRGRCGTANLPTSWPTRRSLGGLEAAGRRYPASPPGGASQAGTSSRPKTG